MRIYCRCHNLAIWYYSPDDREIDGSPILREKYFCDDCVNRRCSCRLIYDEGIETEEEERDSLGRYLPCVEYDYLEEGWDNDLPFNDSDLYDTDD